MGCLHQMSMIDWLSPVYISLPLMCRDFINFITPGQAGYLRWRWHLYRGQCEPCTQDVHLCLSFTSCFACRICISVAQKRTSPAHWCTCFLISEHGVGYAKKTRCRCARIKFKNSETLEFKIHKHLASLLWRNIPGVLSKFPGFEVCWESFLQPNLSIGPADRSLSIQTHLRHGPTRSNKVEQGRTRSQISNSQWISDIMLHNLNKSWSFHVISYGSSEVLPDPDSSKATSNEWLCRRWSSPLWEWWGNPLVVDCRLSPERLKLGSRTKRTRGQDDFKFDWKNWHLKFQDFEFHSTDENFMGIPSIRRLGNIRKWIRMMRTWKCVKTLYPWWTSK